jgi:hypothetical protein
MNGGFPSFVVGRREGLVRRWLLWCAVCGVWTVVGDVPAVAQIRVAATTVDDASANSSGQQPAHRPLIFAPRSVARSAESAANPAAPPAQPAATPSADGNRNGDRDRDGDRNGSRRGHGHHHHHHHGGTWLLWPPVVLGGYPFGPYGPGYPYFVERGFSMTLPMQPAAAVDPPAPAPAPAPQADDKPRTRVTNAEWKARAGKFIGYGDTNFGKQSYLSAVERYKTAAEMAPDLAEPYFRQGFGFVAMGQYASAAKAFRRGLRIRSDWSDSPFRLDHIYGDDQIAKTAHIENLAKAVEANPLDAELLLALGMQIFFNGEPGRAEVFFARAAELGGNEDKLLDGFLPRPGPAGAPKPDDVKKPGGKIVF